MIIDKHSQKVSSVEEAKNENHDHHHDYFLEGMSSLLDFE
jgi:hypothetical protein